MRTTKQLLVFFTALVLEFVLVVCVISLITPQTFIDTLYDPMVKVGMLFLGWIIPIIVAMEYNELN